VPLQHLGHCHLKVVLRDVLPALSERIHACFLADTAHLGTGALTSLLGEGCNDEGTTSGSARVQAKRIDREAQTHIGG
jgi:hypothetical protein